MIDEALRLDIRKQDATIIRAGGNVTTYMVQEETGSDTGRRRLDPYIDHESFIKMPSTSGVVSGDLVLSDSIYYLAMSVEKKTVLGSTGYYKCVFYKCNSTAGIYSLDANNRPNQLDQSNVRCLITQVRDQGLPDDKALIFRQYWGKTQPFQIYLRSSEGLQNTSIIKDQDGRRFRVSKEFDVFIANGITQALVIWEY